MDTEKTTKKEILELAKKSCYKSGFVDVEELTNELGIKLKTNNKDLNGDARINYSNGEFVIIYNDIKPINRIRFSIAHELAHYVNDYESIKKLGTLDRGQKNAINYEMERKADKLAADILVPSDILKENLKKLGIEPEDKPIFSTVILELAKLFRVSTIMMVIRLKELKYNVPFSHLS